MNILFCKDCREQVRQLVCTVGGDSKCQCDACKAFKEGNNPDVLYYDAFEDVPPVKIFREEISSFYETAKNMSKNKVLYIKNIDRLSENCQNALLKYIEDKNDKVHFIASCLTVSDVLPTVRSRMELRRDNDYLSYSDFEKYCFSNAIGQVDIYYAVTGGKLSLISNVGKNIGKWVKLLRLLPEKKNKEEVFKELGIVTEKRVSPFENKEQLKMLFGFMSNVFLNCLMVSVGDEAVIPTIVKTDFQTDELIDIIYLLNCQERYIESPGGFKTKDLCSLMIKIYGGGLWKEIKLSNN